MPEKWTVKTKSGNYTELGKEYGISPVAARILNNRGISGEKAVNDFLRGNLSDLCDSNLLPDFTAFIDAVRKGINEKRHFRVIGDYDIDGVCATYILTRGLEKCGAAVDHVIPDRIRDGYGLNDELIRSAYADGTDIIITCDNGISASLQIQLAYELGMRVLVTDHHEVPYRVVNGSREYAMPGADAIVDPKRPDSSYPYKDLCGAAVVYKLITALTDILGAEICEEDGFLEIAAFATIGDVMPLTGENRILVKNGLERLNNTSNPGLMALIRGQGMDGKKIEPYHIGFVLGPCINATGRLYTAEHAFRLLAADNYEEAEKIAGMLIAMNRERKEMTDSAADKAEKQVELTFSDDDRVIVVFLPDIHESIAGIVAGKLKEKFGKPAFVITRGTDCAKGSGRSIEEYDMFDEMEKMPELFLKFGGHRLAAGFSMKEENIKEFREKINENCTLTEENLMTKVNIDMEMPLKYSDTELAKELDMLAPYGIGNPRPLFAVKDIRIENPRIFGKNGNVLKATAVDNEGNKRKAVYFGQADQMIEYCNSKKNISMTYALNINNYMGRESLELNIKNYR